MPASQCLEAVTALNALYNLTMGRTSLISGSWGLGAHTPGGGCTSQVSGDHAAHYNSVLDASGEPSYLRVCTLQSPYHFSSTSAACDYGWDVGADKCVEAVTLLNRIHGNTAGKSDLTSLTAASHFNTVPGGCSAHSGGDWSAHHYAHISSAGSDFMRVCTIEQPFHYSTRKDRCDSGREVPRSQCLEAAQTLNAVLGKATGNTALHGASRAELVTGSWALPTAPPSGCSVQSGTGGDFAAHWNVHGIGGSGGYARLCTGTPPYLFSSRHGRCEGGTFDVPQHKCLEAARYLVEQSLGRPMGGDALRVANAALASSGVEGACSVQVGGDPTTAWSAMYNEAKHMAGDANTFTRVCMYDYEHIRPAYHFSDTPSACDFGDDVPQEHCLEAVMALNHAEGRVTGRSTLSIGYAFQQGWHGVAGGCSAQTGGDNAAYYLPRGIWFGNSGNGRYSRVCTQNHP